LQALSPLSTSSPRKRTSSAVGRGYSAGFGPLSLCPGYLQHCQSKTGSVMATVYHLGLERDKKGGRDESRHHHRVGMGHSEFTPAETAVPARIVGSRRASVTKRVAETGSPTRSERVSASRVGVVHVVALCQVCRTPGTLGTWQAFIPSVPSECRFTRFDESQSFYACRTGGSD